MISDDLWNLIFLYLLVGTGAGIGFIAGALRACGRSERRHRYDRLVRKS